MVSRSARLPWAEYACSFSEENWNASLVFAGSLDKATMSSSDGGGAALPPSVCFACSALPSSHYIGSVSGVDRADVFSKQIPGAAEKAVSGTL